MAILTLRILSLFFCLYEAGSLGKAVRSLSPKGRFVRLKDTRDTIVAVINISYWIFLIAGALVGVNLLWILIALAFIPKSNKKVYIIDCFISAVILYVVYWNTFI